VTTTAIRNTYLYLLKAKNRKHTRG